MRQRREARLLVRLPVQFVHAELVRPGELGVARVAELGATLSLRTIDAGPLTNACPVEGITALPATINRRYKKKNAGIRITGV